MLHRTVARGGPLVHKLEVVNAEDTGVPKGMRAGGLLGRQNHDVGLCGGVNGVLVSSHVVGREVNSEGLDAEYLVVNDSDSFTLFFGVLSFVPVEVATKESREQVVVELGNEALRKP